MHRNLIVYVCDNDCCVYLAFLLLQNPSSPGPLSSFSSSLFLLLLHLLLLLLRLLLRLFFSLFFFFFFFLFFFSLLLLLLFLWLLCDWVSPVQLKMLSMRSKKAHMRSTASLRRFPNVAFEAVPNVHLTDDGGPFSSFQGSSVFKCFHFTLTPLSCVQSMV